MRRITLCVLAILVAMVPGDAETQARSLSDLAVVAIRGAEDRRIAFEGTGLVVTTRSVLVKPGDNVDSLISRQHVEPDAESYALIYELNPNLRRLALVPGNRVLVPVITGPPQLQSALTHGYTAHLTTHVTLKRSVASLAQGLPALVSGMNSLPSHRLGGDARKAQLGDAMKHLSDFSRAVGLGLQERTRVADAEVLGQVRAELSFVAATVSTLLSSDSSLNVAHQDAIIALGDDVVERSAAYWTETMGIDDARRPRRYPRISIVVRTVRGGREQKGFEVCYVPRALYGIVAPDVFSGLSSPSARALPLANYFVWARTPGDTTRRSQLRTIKGRDMIASRDTVLDLVILP